MGAVNLVRLNQKHAALAKDVAQMGEVIDANAGVLMQVHRQQALSVAQNVAMKQVMQKATRRMAHVASLLPLTPLGVVVAMMAVELMGLPPGQRILVLALVGGLGTLVSCIVGALAWTAVLTDERLRQHVAAAMMQAAAEQQEAPSDDCEEGAEAPPEDGKSAESQGDSNDCEPAAIAPPAPPPPTLKALNGGK